MNVQLEMFTCQIWYTHETICCASVKFVFPIFDCLSTRLHINSERIRRTLEDLQLPVIVPVFVENKFQELGVDIDGET